MSKSNVPLTESQINQLKSQGCSAETWSAVTISNRTDLSRLVNVRFAGSVRLGDTSGSVSVEGVDMPCGIYHAVVANCRIGDHVRIASIGSVLSNYEIEEGAVIVNVASMIAEPGCSFGNGVELETVNEGGGRGVKIINDLTSQVAYAQAMMRHDTAFLARLSSLIDAKVAQSQLSMGTVGRNARIIHCGSLKNVIVGPYAFLHGVLYLDNGTVNSCPEHPSEVGEGVVAKSFILSEGARVDGGAMIDKVFVGQGVRMGKQYSAENSLFFANCEAFHGEAVALFGGPYTVTHHKSTLLIAGLFSFYNAGSGSNQSNHMYKLGPVHQGVLERGCKTGSFSYLLWEAHLGAFSVVIGKHYTNIDAPNLPFSYFFEGEPGTMVLPGLNLCSVGTERDGEKWPQRDHRKAPIKRDLISFDVFSPYTIEKMRRGRNELRDLNSQSSAGNAVVYRGLHIKRTHLQKGVQYYEWAVSRYLNGLVAQQLADALEHHKDWKHALSSLTPRGQLRRVGEWTDVGGLLAPVERVEALEEDIIRNRISSYDEMLAAFQAMEGSSKSDQWQYVFETFVKEYSIRPDQFTKEQAVQIVEGWMKSEEALHALIVEDSKKEFGAFARIGYGIDRTEDKSRNDFEAVRGTEQTNSVIRKLEKKQADLQTTKARFLQLISQT